MTEFTTRDLLRHEMRDLFEPITALRGDHDRVASAWGMSS
jgi:hypothetical protein